MSSRTSRPAKRPALVAQCLLLLAVAIAVLSVATAKASDYKMVLCAGNNGSNGYGTSTNTTSPQNPSGIFEFVNACGPAPDPAGDHAWLRIVENQNSGNAGQGAYGNIYYDTPPFIHFRRAGGYTRQPAQFNDGWRSRFWIAGGSAGNWQLMTQGAGLPNAGDQWASSNIFGPHLWPFGGHFDFTRFVFEMTCVRPAGCDRAGYNAADANSFVFILADESPSQVSLTNTDKPLLGGRWVRGIQTATYTFTELGSGIRMERLRIDGANGMTLDHSCDRDYTQTNGEFARSFQPCAVAPSPVGRSHTFDTAALSDGAHTVSVCTQDYAQWQGLFGWGGESCDQRTARTDNTAPGAPAGLFVTSANPQRYLDHFGARFSLPPNEGSPIAKVHYDVIDATGEGVVAEKVLSATNPTELTGIAGPAKPGDYRLRVWLEDEVGFTGPAAVAAIPHDTVPPAAPQALSVATPTTPRSDEGFDLRWQNIVDAGSPIEAAHYEVLDGAGKVVVTKTSVRGENVQALGSLDAPGPAGPYQLRLWLTDAEGNVGAPVTAPLAYDCARSTVVGGQELTANFGGGSDATVQQGHAAILSGSLRGQTGPVATASVCVFTRVTSDSGLDFLGIAMTDRGGSYRFPVPAGPSREAIAIHRPDQRQLRASATLHTVVHPALRARSTVVRNGESAYFEGEIPGPHNDNVTIVLQVRSGKGWLAFRRYRSRGNGHYEFSYPFRRTTRRTDYEMRAQVRESVGYPYEEGDSDPVVLHVLPGKAKPHIAKKESGKRRCAKRTRAGHRRGPKRCHSKKRGAVRRSPGR
jgi:hypothetical protein